MKNVVTKLRNSLGFSKTEMALQLNMTLGCLYNYEHGKRFPRPDMAYRIIALAKSNGIMMSLEDLYPKR